MPSIFSRPGDAPYSIPQAADYVADMVEREGTRAEQRFTLYSTGSRQREDRVQASGWREATYTNLKAGQSWQVSRGPDGKKRALTIDGYTTIFDVAATTRSDRLLDEACTVYRLTPRDTNSPAEEACVTDDAILLWQKVFYSNGTILSEAHAVRIARRRVAPSEVTVPAYALDPASYGDWTPGAALPDDEVRLKGSSALLIRRLGALSFSDDVGREIRLMDYKNATYDLHAEIGKDGRVLRLDLAPNPPVFPAVGVDASGLVDTILGRSCHSTDMAKGVSDYGETRCLTADGLTLSKSTWSRGGSTSLRAVSVRKGLKPAELTPPAGLLKGHLPQ